MAIGSAGPIDRDTNSQALKKDKEWRTRTLQSSKWFQRWSVTQQLQDIWRMQNPITQEYTRHPEGNHAHKRIDMMLISKNIANAITESRHIPIEEVPWNSDHDLVSIKMLSLPSIRKLGRTPS